MVLLWIKFAVCVAIIAIAGNRVAKYGDVIAVETGLGRVWIGVVLLAVVTSLPELFTGISAVALVEAPDLAIGDLFGSNAVNLLIIALLDIAYRGSPLLGVASRGLRLTAWLSMVLVVFAAACIFISIHFSNLGIGWIGIYTPIIILLFLFMIGMIFNYERHHPSATVEVKLGDESLSLHRTYLYFAVAALFVIGAGIWLAFIGGEIVEITGWEESLVGTLFIAFTTSLPEIVVSFSALRSGAIDLSIGNIIGSNLFNMAIIGIVDLFYWEGPVLAAVSGDHIFTALIVLVMTGVFIAGLTLQPQRKTPLGISWYALALMGVFIVGTYVNFW